MAPPQNKNGFQKNVSPTKGKKVLVASKNDKVPSVQC
jgi:hypothetical protein